MLSDHGPPIITTGSAPVGRISLEGFSLDEPCQGSIARHSLRLDGVAFQPLNRNNDGCWCPCCGLVTASRPILGRMQWLERGATPAQLHRSANVSLGER